MTTSEEQIFYSVVTDIGIEKINEALQTGRKIDLKYSAIGDSNGTYYEPTVTQTELVNETFRAEISSVDELTARARIPFDVGGFYEDLFFYIGLSGLEMERDNFCRQRYGF